MGKRRPKRLTRREFLRLTGVTVGAAALSGITEMPTLAAGSNPTTVENSKTGTTAWQLQFPSAPVKAGEGIEGYASLTSVNRGGSIQFFVNTGDTHFTIDIYRMGWYNG